MYRNNDTPMTNSRFVDAYKRQSSQDSNEKDGDLNDVLTNLQESNPDLDIYQRDFANA